ncbi:MULTISPECIES: hypothetical protein [unclassified Bacillus (in: firmicutes)]|uniref:hypothetical protein n=1 Tax=Bacillaceae TaxID=186817 RepID=UPI000BEFB370|nr:MULTISPECIES: hypothetical protein [unclassified Bacillus (in: firmicutes)]PEJ48737.1 hypothetical protein CN692_23415 [Bacillus sp. AFS002410]PEK98273.1 hypothetical protein CN601_25935 [Bacillus sp. AFS017336]QKE75141.1 hypothetical protein HPK19_21510 [Arthrobacter citreus]
MKEFRFSWYVFRDNEVEVVGGSFVRGEKIEDEMNRIIQKLSKEYYVRPSSVLIIESSEIK